MTTWEQAVAAEGKLLESLGDMSILSCAKLRTASRLPRWAFKRYTSGYCWVLAQELMLKSGAPPVMLSSPYSFRSPKPPTGLHCGVLTTEGLFLDAYGVQELEAVRRQWERAEEKRVGFAVPLVFCSPPEAAMQRLWQEEPVRKVQRIARRLLSC
jgi:hypothetical protein